MVDGPLEELRAAHERLKEALAQPPQREPLPSPGRPAEVVTAVPAERLRALDAELVAVPRASRSTRSSHASSSGGRMRSTEGGIDWGHAESLAFASLLVDGIPIRLTGQDTERGTFSQRHLVFHDPETGERYAPIQHLTEATRRVRAPQLPAVRVRRARLRVRLLGRCARRRSCSGRRSSATSSTTRR